MNCQVISTGSKGNAVFLDDKILIDCGVPYSRLEKADIVRKIKFIFLTHQHKDHLNIKTIRRLLENRPTIKVIYPKYLCRALQNLSGNAEFLYANSCIIEINKWYQLGDFKFSCFPLRHDVENVGWKFYINCSNLCNKSVFKAIYATDTASLDGVVAKNYDLYLIEANYSQEDIVNRIKEKRQAGQYVYEERVLKTHLSKEKADDFICNNIGCNGSFIYLHGHQTRED